MRELIDQPLLSAGDTTWTYGDAVLVGLHLGLWQELEGRVSEGLARQLAGLVPEEAELAQAIVAFRRERRLLAAEDLRLWLQARELTAADLQGCMAREALRERDLFAAAPPDPERLQAVMRAEAFVSGTLGECARALSDRAVAFARHPEATADPTALAALVAEAKERGLDVRRARAVLDADAAHAAMLEAAASEERLRARLAERRLDLTRVRLEAIELAEEQAAREAVLCVTVDGLGLAQVAARAGVECRSVDEEIGQLEDALRTGVASGRPGELVGPLPGDGSWHVAVVQERTAPLLADQAVRARLTEELGRRAIQRQAAGRVVWHGDF